MSVKSNLEGLASQFDQIFAFDVETTGLDSKKDEIIELAFAEIEITTDSFLVENTEDNYVLLDNQSIPEFITNLTGITNDFLSQNGIARSFVARKVMERLDHKKTLLIAHNANIDYNFLISMLNKEGYSVDFANICILDTLTIFKDRHRYPHKLSDAINAYGLSDHVVNSHRAIDDTIATVLVLDAMYREYNDISHYVNVIGINPKYGLNPNDRVPTLIYCEQPYDNNSRLYELL